MTSTKSEMVTNNESSSVSTLSQEETRQILTPFAFEVDKSLFGIALASPTKRALAICIDLLFIAMLSDTPGEVLALVIAITLYRLGSKKRAIEKGKVKGGKRRKLLRFISVFIVFVVLLETLPMFFNNAVFGPENTKGTESIANLSENSLSTSQSIAFSALTAGTILTISSSECQQLRCWQQKLAPLVEPFSSFNLKAKIVDELIEAIVDATKLDKSEQSQLNSYLHDAYQSSVEQYKVELKEENLQQADFERELNKNIDSDKIAPAVEKMTEDIEKAEQVEKGSRPIYSIMEYVKGIIEDLGLGFGWAAFYFTVFTALWHGQTPGKKILGIKVLQLDGTPLSMWDSFGRYGGYGAGLATGLLGFMQIFWNANRQAIQDQISATVVVDVRKQSDKPN